jgi:hypothetical protein
MSRPNGSRRAGIALRTSRDPGPISRQTALQIGRKSLLLAVLEILYRFEVAMPSNGIRPRTARDLKLKARRCPKCGRLVNRQLKRCKTCAQVLVLPKKKKK